jgi:uncharacterized protein (DUF885 family)
VRRLYRPIANSALIVCCVVLIPACKKNINQQFPAMEEEFVGTALSFSPASATAQGYHSHMGADLDSALDDVSGQSIQKQRDYYSAFHRKLQDVDRDTLAPEDQADYDMIQDQIALALLDSDVIQTWRHNPTYYVELLGNALFSPYVLEYAPKETRAQQLVSRVGKIPRFLDQAKRNLTEAPPVWIQVAKEENQGNIDLVDKTLRAFMPPAMEASYSQVADRALLELREFDRFLAETLPNRKGGKEIPDWRLGEETYKLKFRFALETDLLPAQVLKSAESDLKRVRREMFEISKKLGATGDENHAIREALNKIAQNHSKPENYLDDAKADLDEARAFVQQKNLLTLPTSGNLQVIETPEFMRGIYAVGGFNPAPALEPKLGAFYWVTPIPVKWEQARIDSKLREYNFYNLKLLTIHEAMPGHYVQGEFANAVQPKSRRVLRGVFGNTPNVEGWAQYATQTMLDEGFLDHSPELQLTLLKQELRVLANAIIDIRMQGRHMSEQQALELMEKETFQEHEEAVAKIQRAQLSSAQLPAYLVGWRDWIRVRDQYKASKGASYRLHDFHDAALKEGAVPLPVLGRLLTGKPLPTLQKAP